MFPIIRKERYRRFKKMTKVAKRLGDTIDTVSNTYLHTIEKVEKESVNLLQEFINDNIRTN